MTAGRPSGTARPQSLPLSVDIGDDFGDPAKGAKVPRCGACGMPSRTVLRGTWQGIHNISFPVCASCISRWNGPQPTDTDPLNATEAA